MVTIRKGWVGLEFGKLLLVTLLLCTEAAKAGEGAPFKPGTLYDISIPSHGAIDAFNLLIDQTGREFLFPYDLAENRTTQAVTGKYTVLEALNLMLHNTGLSCGLSEKGAIRIFLSDSSLNNNEETSMKKNKLSIGVFAALASLFGGGVDVVAQTENSDTVLEEIVVTGVRASLARAVDLKRNSASIVDTISAEDIGDFPDLNISESLQRITGVTIERNLGEGTQVSVRGLRPEFTQVLINGQTVTSGNNGREVDFDVFASELFSAVEVAKSHSASSIEGGLAGSINLKTGRPFDLIKGNDDTVFSLTGQLVQNEIASDTDPRISALGAVKLMDGRLGLLGSIAYSETHLRQDNVEGLRFRTTTATVGGESQLIEYPFIPRYLVEFKERDRLGVTGAVQFEVNDSVDINLDLAYAEFDEVRTRHSVDGLILGQIADPANSITVAPDGLVTQAELANLTSRSENIRTPSSEDLLLINLDTTWQGSDNWSATAKLGFSKATKEEREFRSTWNNNGTFAYDLSDRTFIGISQVGQDITDAANFDDRHEARFINNDVDDEETSLQFDVERVVGGNLLSSLEAGVRINNREKTRAVADGRVRVTGVTLADYEGSFPVSDFFSQYGQSQIIRSWAVPDFDAVLNDTTLIPAGFTPSPQLISNFGVKEDNFSAYLQANIDGESGDLPIRGHVGVRVVNTEQISSGFASSAASPTGFVAVSQDKTYTEVLPSATLTFNLTDDLLLRAAAARSLTRPTVTSLTPGGQISFGVNEARFGNPELDPFTADNYDLSLEWYFGEEGLLSAALFHKDVSGFITNVTSSEVLGADVLGSTDDRAGQSFDVTRPINGDEAFVQGYELAIQTPFSFLPAPFDNFGMSANYTYSDSESTVTFQGEEITTLLPGQSESSYNLVGYYEQEAFSVRLAYAWRDFFLDQIRPGTERSNYIQDYGQLDMNIQYNLTDNITLTFDGLNLLEEEQYRYGGLEDRNVRFSETGRFFLLGARMKF